MSVDLFKNCPKCGESIPISKKVCPKCGYRKKLRWYHWVLIVFGGLTLLGIVSGGDKSSKTVAEQPAEQAVKQPTPPAPEQAVKKQTTLVPEPQRKFVEIATAHKKTFKGAKNELQQSSIKKQRQKALAELGLGMRVEGWVGSIKRMETTSDGKAGIVIDIGSGIYVRTWNNALSDIGTNTLIHHDTALYETLSQMERGQKIQFSGSFIPSRDDHYRETSLTIEGSMSEPEFLFQFTQIDNLN